MTDSTGVGATDADEARNALFGAGPPLDPYPLFAQWSSGCPVTGGSISEHFDVPPGSDAGMLGGRERFSVHSHDACSAVLRDHRTFSSSWYAEGVELFAGHQIIAMDRPEHRRMRALLQPAFAKPEMRRWWVPEIIRPIVDEHLDRIAPLGTCDLYAELGAAVPVHTIAAALGLPVAERARFFDWSVRMTSGAEEIGARLAASEAMAELIRPIVAERRRVPGQDLISMLVAARVEDDPGQLVDGLDRRPLSDEEITGIVRFLVIAGAGTTYRAFGNLMFALLTHPDQYADLLAHPDLVPNAIEESLRLEQPLANFGRVAVTDTEVAGTPIAAGCPVNVNVGAANHDAAKWADPDRFDIRRERADRHLTFGLGIHICIGIHLARAELDVMLRGVLQRLPGLRLDTGESGVHMTGLGFRMPSRLPVRYSAR